MPFNDLLRQRMQPLTNMVTTQRFTLYALASTIAVVAVIANACRNYSNFYSIAVYLGRSGRSVLFLANFCVVLALASGKVLQKVFFGQLQPREVERLYDQTWMFVTESLLAFTIFRDEFDIPFAIMFGFLLFVKCFHWLMGDRMESMDQVPYPGPGVLFHVRMVVLFSILATVDVVSLGVAMNTIFTEGVGGTVLFANEYAILLASALNSIAKYCINIIEFRHARAQGGETAPPWENKSMYLFYVELFTDFMKLTTYLLFFSLIIVKHGLPLNMIRDVYITARSFVTRFRALTRYLSATRDMDRRYPNATEAELNDMSDRTCIICRDELTFRDPRTQPTGPNTTPKKLPCGHIFHFNCLRSWLERQQSCPTCRRTVLESTPQRRTGQAQRNPPQPQPAARPVPRFGGPALAGDNPGQQPPNWLNRFLNAAAQPPLVPGQFGNAGNGNGANGVQHGALGFTWGQQPAGNQQQAPATPLSWGYPPPAQLQPPPQFPGFYGPDGVWHPWGTQLPLQQPQARPAPRPAERDVSAPVPQSLTTPISDSISASDTASSSLTDSESTNATLFDPPRESAGTREAALNAALRRLALQPGGNSMDTAISAVNGTTSIPPPSPSITNSVPTQPQPSGQPMAGQTQASSSQPHPSTSSSVDPNPATAVPRLLPLTDFSPTPTTFPSTPSFVFSSPTPPITRYPQSPRHPGPLSPFYYPPTQNYQTPPTFASRLNVEPNPRRNGLDELLEQLPSTMNEEEIRKWDQVTREAIDERLRVLGRVDEIVNRLVDELTRLRSTIPSPEGTVPDARPPLDSIGEGSNRKQGRNTGKQKEIVPEDGS